MKIPILISLLAIGLARTCRADDPTPTPAPTPLPPPTDVVLYEHAKVDDAFAKGFPLNINSSYKVQCGHRVVPGFVEIHAYDTDVFYIVQGSATFVTGGTAVDVTVGKHGESRAKSITGGTARHLEKGDVIIIPAGIPHWFTEVNGPFDYFVVKVTRLTS